MIRNKVVKLIILVLCCFLLCACTDTSQSSFNIQFIDVGQGDSALVECDGHYMLIDGGDEKAGDKVYSVLADKGIQKLDILAISHMHADHIGGLPKALTYASTIDLTISNTERGEKETFRKLEHELGINGATIEVPHVGDKYELGSAIVEVVDISATGDNDSLVLLITYGDTRFLFTGDIQDDAQTRIADKYQNEDDKETKIDLIKMPHHGSTSPKSMNGTGSLYRFIRTFMPDYAIISVGKDNPYGHPHRETMDLLDDAEISVYRTDQNGDIFVKSDGKTVSITTSK